MYNKEAIYSSFISLVSEAFPCGQPISDFVMTIKAYPWEKSDLSSALQYQLLSFSTPKSISTNVEARLPQEIYTN